MKNNFRNFYFLFLERTYYTSYHNFKVKIYSHASCEFATSIILLFTRIYKSLIRFSYNN